MCIGTEGPQGPSGQPGLPGGPIFRRLMEEHYTLKVSNAEKRVTLTYFYEVKVNPEDFNDTLDLYGAVIELDHPDRPAGQKPAQVRLSQQIGSNMREAALETYHKWALEFHKAVSGDPVQFALLWCEIRKAEVAGKGG